MNVIGTQTTGYSATRFSSLKPGDEEQREALVNVCQWLTADEQTLLIGVILEGIHAHLI